MQPDRFLLVGCGGMLAYAVRRSLARRGIRPGEVDRSDCDITNSDAVRGALERHRPQVLVNCAAYTAVDKAEQEEDRATRVNGAGAGNLADACRDVGALLVHFSTDFVFDGRSERPYREDDPPNPLGAYGRSKLAGEVAIEQSGLADWLTIRTAWLYGPGEGVRPFPKAMLEAARAGTPLRVVSDQTGSPTFTCDLAEACLSLVEHDARGLFHVTNSGSTTWHAFAVETLRVFGVEAEIEAITSEAWRQVKPETAPRPAYSVLDNSRAEQIIGRPMRPWQNALREYRDLTAGSP